MAFRFALAAVLQLRESLERHQELVLQRACARFAEIQRTLETITAETQQMVRDESVQLTTGMKSAELQFDMLRHTALDQFKNEIEEKLSEAEATRSACVNAFEKARQSRQVLASLEEGQLEVYRRDQERQAQCALDDLFLLRRSCLARE